MTPLAHSITKQLTLPVASRTFVDQCGLLKNMGDIHCFEVTDVFDMIADLAMQLGDTAEKMGALRLMATQTFLPAEKTWIEWKYDDGSRDGVLVEMNGKNATCNWAHSSGKYFASNKRHGFIILDGHVATLSIREPWPVVRDIDGEDMSRKRGWIFFIYAAIAIINTPKIVGRRQHMPHRGLERKLVSQRGLVGKFPLHAWTEIKLEVTAPRDASGDGSQEAHYTGERALHFCRAHLRVRLGKLEVVRAHWRGDPSLGIKQSRYRLTA